MKKNSPTPTREDELRLLDLKIAEQLFGAKYCGKPRGNGYWQLDCRVLWRTTRGKLDSSPTAHLPRYSEDLFSAMLVVKEMENRHIETVLSNSRQLTFTAYSARFIDLNKEYEEWSDSWPEAICKAALAALEGK